MTPSNHLRSRAHLLAGVACLTLGLPAAFAQLSIVGDGAGDASGAAAQAPARALSPDEQVVLDARRAIAASKPAQATKLLDDWIAKNEGAAHPLFPEALYLRGNAKLAQGDEYDALYDYERVVNEFPGSEFFVSSLEKELEVAKLYFAGLRRPGLWGLRIDSGVPVAEEIVVRIGERLPGSKLAERALLTLADFYATSNDLRMAAETYDVWQRLFPRSPQRALVLERRIYANVAQFKGPEYDGSVLRDASVQIEQFQGEFPAQAEESGLTDALQARLDESQAQGLLTTARWYLKRDDPVAARVTLLRLIRSHPRSGAAQQALGELERIAALLPAPPQPPQAPPPQATPAQSQEPRP